MIEIGDGDSQSFVLPLEDIDLTCLSKYVRNPREKMPLWTRKHLDGENGLYEMKISPQEFDEDDSYYEPSETYKCHICNTDVPEIFFQEHNGSLKHKKIKNIFEKMLERLSKHINFNVDVISSKDNNQDFYYCVPCSKAVNRKNKYKHEATDYHKNSLKNIHILNDFHEIFTEINDKVAQNSMEDPERGKRIDTPPPVVFNDLDSGTKNNHFYNNDKLLNAFNDLTIERKENLPEKATALQKEEVSFGTYLRNAKAKYYIGIDLPTVEGEYINIINTNGVKVKIPQAHYQGYKYIVNRTFCIVCGEWAEDLTRHDEKESHIRNLFKPFDEDFVRKINERISHCLICNVSVASPLHWVREDHKKTLDNMKVVQTQNTQYNDADVNKTKQTLCEVCNKYIDTHNFIGHTKSKIHNTLKDNQMTKINANQLSCRKCNVLLHLKDLSNHVNSSNHNASKVPNLNAEYCDVCQVSVPIGGMQIHRQGKPHKTKDAENNKKNAQNGYPNQRSPSIASTSTNSVYSTASNSTNTPGFDDKVNFYYKLLIYFNENGKTKVKCSICNVEVPNLRQNIIEHMQGWRHRNEIDAYKKLVVFTDNTKTKIRCKICDVSMPDNERTVIEHMKGKLHESELTALLQYHAIDKEGNHYYCKCCQEGFSNYLDHINSITHTRTFQSEYNIDKSLLRKYIYEIDANHGLAVMYRELYKNLILTNKIIKLNENTFYCQYCNIRVGRLNEIDHMLGDRHEQNVESDEESDSSDD